MKLPENKRKLMEAVEEFMKTDRAKHAVLPISKFGLMQITRQRMKPEMNINTQEVCPGCNGTGKISSALILEDDIEKNLSYLVTHQHKNLTVAINPIIHAFLTKGLFFSSKLWKWRKKYGWGIHLKSNSNYQLTEFHFFDQHEEEIKL
jgi:ribonuclease G